MRCLLSVQLHVFMMFSVDVWCNDCVYGRAMYVMAMFMVERCT